MHWCIWDNIESIYECFKIIDLLNCGKINLNSSTSRSKISSCEFCKVASNRGDRFEDRFEGWMRTLREMYFRNRLASPEGALLFSIARGNEIRRREFAWNSLVDSTPCSAREQRRHPDVNINIRSDYRGDYCPEFAGRLTREFMRSVDHWLFLPSDDRCFCSVFA